MKTVLGLTLVSASLVLAGAATAQTAITPGANLGARLTSSDPKLPDDSHYHCYNLQTEANKVYTVNMLSDDFDTFLSAGPGRSCDDLSVSNDDGPDMGTNSQLTFMGQGGVWAIRANSLGSDATGQYRLRVSRGETVRPTRDILPLMLGASTAGELAYGDRVADDGSLYDCYTIQMRSEDTIAIRMDSKDFDAYLGLYAGNTCEGNAMAMDDDSGGGTSAEIVERLAAGTYSVRANSIASDSLGSYSITMTVRR